MPIKPPSRGYQVDRDRRGRDDERWTLFGFAIWLGSQRAFRKPVWRYWTCEQVEAGLGLGFPATRSKAQGLPVLGVGSA